MICAYAGACWMNIQIAICKPTSAKTHARSNSRWNSFLNARATSMSTTAMAYLAQEHCLATASTWKTAIFSG